ncbi:MAG: hemerythrin HHE cation binding domain-containing protein [Gallionellaceae bacterium]|nr:MAG: hemerythrin HHE cation binding domain-containing protein [Gallionellaceae bacterium]
MNSLLGSTSAPTFDDPLEMLQACHGRIEAQCVTLHRLVDHLATQEHDEQAVQAARAILRYFDTAGQHHHQDEEQDLFPQLLSTQDQTAASIITRLLQEHKTMEAAWQSLRPLLMSIAAAQSKTVDASIARHFIDVYAKHIELENETLLPLAATLLNNEKLRAIGQSMAARRGVSI